MDGMIGSTPTAADRQQATFIAVRERTDDAKGS
jgi:hypothetical protein